MYIHTYIHACICVVRTLPLSICECSCVAESVYHVNFHHAVIVDCWSVRFVLGLCRPLSCGFLPLQKAEESQQRREVLLEHKLAQQNKTSWASTTKKKSVALFSLVLWSFILCSLHTSVYCITYVGTVGDIMLSFRFYKTIENWNDLFCHIEHIRVRHNRRTV